MQVSVIIPAYNSAATIARAIESTLRQPVDDFEVLVIDDCSTDQTCTQVNTIMSAAGNRVRLIPRTVNGGAAAARNSGLAQSTGELIAFLDADDAWVDKGLAHLVERMGLNRTIEIVQGQFIDHWFPEGESSAHTGPPRFANRLTGVLYRRSVFDSVGLLDESLRSGEDFDFWVRIRHQGLAIERLPVVVASYTRRPNNDPEKATRYHSSLAHTLKKNLDRYRGSNA